jgi:hypothetical protein
MTATDDARLRQLVRRTETPDADLHAGGLSTVEAACHEFLRKRGLIHKLTSRYSALPAKKGVLAASRQTSAAFFVFDVCREDSLSI